MEKRAPGNVRTCLAVNGSKIGILPDANRVKIEPCRNIREQRFRFHKLGNLWSPNPAPPPKTNAKVVFDNPGINAPVYNPNELTLIRTGGGCKLEHKDTWWGHYTYRDSCETQKLINQLQGRPWVKDIDFALGLSGTTVGAFLGPKGAVLSFFASSVPGCAYDRAIAKYQQCLNTTGVSYTKRFYSHTDPYLVPVYYWISCK